MSFSDTKAEIEADREEKAVAKRRLTQAEVGELVCLEQELAALKKEHGIQDTQGLIERWTARYYTFKDRHVSRNPVRRKTYLWLCLLSVFGVNQFYAHHPVRGLIYLALCWTGLPLAFGLVDWMEALPKQTDEEGCILV